MPATIHLFIVTMWRQHWALIKKTIEEPCKSIQSTWQTRNAVPQSACRNPFAFLDNKKQMTVWSDVTWLMRMQLATPLTNPSPNSAPQNLRGIERVWLMIRENHYQPLSSMSIAYHWSSTPSQAVIHAHGVHMGAACTNCGQLCNTTDPRESNQIIWHNARLAQVLCFQMDGAEH